MDKRIVKVIFIDPQVNPDGTGPVRQTFDLCDPKAPRMKNWLIQLKDGFIVIADDAGHEVEIPAVRVQRLYRA